MAQCCFGCWICFSRPCSLLMVTTFFFDTEGSQIFVTPQPSQGTSDKTNNRRCLIHVWLGQNMSQFALIRLVNCWWLLANETNLMSVFRSAVPLLLVQSSKVGGWTCNQPTRAKNQTCGQHRLAKFPVDSQWFTWLHTYLQRPTFETHHGRFGQSCRVLSAHGQKRRFQTRCPSATWSMHGPAIRFLYFFAKFKHVHFVSDFVCGCRSKTSLIHTCTEIVCASVLLW